MATEHLPKTAQHGVTDRPPEHLVLAALTFQAGNPSDCHAAAERLRNIVRDELHGQLADSQTETGELGFANVSQRGGLMITVGLSSSGYDKLGQPEGSPHRPVDLHPMPDDVIDPDAQITGREPQPPNLPGEGDIIVKIASNDVYITEHVLRRIQHELSSDFTVQWMVTGSNRYSTSQESHDPRKEARALIGFLDGTNNLDPGSETDRALIFTDHGVTSYPPNPTPGRYDQAQFPELRPLPALPEPAELDGGTYLAVEVLLLDIGAFDNESRSSQEAIVGRTKDTGQPAGNAVDSSHVLKANPHRPGTDDEKRRLLRRGYPLIRATDGQMTLGLVFLAFARSLTTQHEFVRRAWIDNPNFPHVDAGVDQLLATYVKRPLEAGGYYFVPPLTKTSDQASWLLPPLP